MDDVKDVAVQERLDTIARLADEIARTPGLPNDGWAIRKIDQRAREIRRQVRKLSETLGSGRRRRDGKGRRSDGSGQRVESIL